MLHTIQQFLFFTSHIRYEVSPSNATHLSKLDSAANMLMHAAAVQLYGLLRVKIYGEILLNVLLGQVLNLLYKVYMSVKGLRIA